MALENDEKDLYDGIKENEGQIVDNKGEPIFPLNNLADIGVDNNNNDDFKQDYNPNDYRGDPLDLALEKTHSYEVVEERPPMMMTIDGGVVEGPRRTTRVVDYEDVDAVNVVEERPDNYENMSNREYLKKLQELLMTYSDYQATGVYDTESNKEDLGGPKL